MKDTSNLTTDYIPQDYRRIRVVTSRQDLINAEFNRTVNVVLLPRPEMPRYGFNKLAQNIADYFGLKSGSISFTNRYKKPKQSDDRIYALSRLDDFYKKLSSGFLRKRFDAIRDDMDFARNHGFSRTDLRIVLDYSDKTTNEFHVDSGYIKKHRSKGRLMSCYTKPVTEGARNRDIDDPHKGSLVEGAEYFSFKPCDMWRHAVRETSDQDRYSTPPFYHRSQPSQDPRLLTVADIVLK